ncbi:MAG: reprolysin-like metallopeptidase [Polyangiaceae bacterium]
MSDMRLGRWALVGLSVALGTVACVDGGASSGQGPALNTTVAGASGAGTTPGAGASGMGTVADGSCKDTLTDPAHCGSCTTACTQGQTCDQGVCKAPVANCTAPQVSCNGVCADLTSTAHCGKCETACVTGQSCTAGACVCPGTQAACNGACIDTQTSNDNCGGCNMPCATGAVCTAGVCGCATGQTQCNGACIDSTSSAANCGGCGMACKTGETCSSSTCVSGAGADGCSGGPALGIALKSIDVYQSVKVPVMTAGAEVTTDKRTTDIVTGRPTMFRLSVALDSGFTARQLSARITVNNGATASQYFVKQAVSKDSVETEPASTFQVLVPAEQITVDTHYSAELVECATGTGTAGSARYPKTGDAVLDARHTGGLKVTLIPLQANNNVPDTSETALTTYRQQMLAMYPIDAITFTVAPPLTVAYPVDWEATLDKMRAKRKTDNPAADVYYYGLLKPVASFNTFCGNGCTTGIGYVGDANSGSYRAAMGVGYADRVSAQTMAHEIGHNHGRNHAPCVPNGGSISGVDPKYPFPDGKTGIIGYDARTKVLLSATGTDLMGYCSNVWLSEYTYGGITDRVALVNGNKNEVFSAATLQPWRVLIVSASKGARWGEPITTPSSPEGTAVTARVVNDAGALIEETTVYRTDMSDSGAASFMVPEPKQGWSGVQVPGSAVVKF